MNLKRIALGLLILSAVIPGYARAAEKLTSGGACSSDTNVLDWDTVWDCVSSAWSRAALFIGTSTDTCDATHAGEISYSSSTNPHAIQYCNGTAWTNIVNINAQAAQPPADSAWFVLTSTLYNGNLGGSSGADTKCVTELQGNSNWLGYANVNANSRFSTTYIHAFSECTGASTCPALLANTTYYFARVGDVGVGGASFTTDASGLGPNDSANWSAGNYFGGTFYYWSNRNSNSTTQWTNTWPSSGLACTTSSAWDTGTISKNGNIGISSSSVAARWKLGGVSCENTLPLICYVNP